MTCKICGKYELSRFKICHNCIILGPDKPGVYIIPKGSDLPSYVHNRRFPIVPDEEIPKIYEEYLNDVAKFGKKMTENMEKNK